MTGPRTLCIVAAVSGREAQVVEDAASRLCICLGEADQAAWTLDIEIAPDRRSLQSASPDAICIISLASLLADLETPWTTVEAQLQADIEALSALDRCVVLLTVLRYIEPGPDRSEDQRRLHRLRQLNLLAAKLSQTFSVLVADLDRDLADVGALALSTDYRLGGAAAVEMAGWTLAACILANALDGLATYDVQDAALAANLGRKPVAMAVEVAMLDNVVQLGRGRRRQRVATVTIEVQRDHAHKLITQVMKGQMALPEALSRISRALRRRGPLETAQLLMSAISRHGSSRGA